MLTIRYDDKEDTMYFKVKYNAAFVEAIKTLPERRWNKKKMRWEVPVNRESVLRIRRMFKGAQWHPHLTRKIDYWEMLRGQEERSRETNAIRLRKLSKTIRAAVASGDAGLLDRATCELHASLPDHLRSGINSYQPKRRSFIQQQIAFAEAVDRDFYGLLMEMGTGKTKVAIDLLDYWFTQRLVTGALVVCPNTVKGAWELEVETFSRYGKIVRIDSGYKGNRVLQDLLQNGPSKLTIPIVITNYEALRTKHGALFAAFLERHRSVMILDESCSIKNGEAQQTEAALALGTLAKKRLIMDGTPIGNNPLDLYTQCKFLSPDVLGFGSFYAFKNYFAQLGGSNGQVPVHWQNMDVLRRRILGHGYRVLKSECLDLPKKMYEIREVAMNHKQDIIYRRLRDEMLLELEHVEGKVPITNSFAMLEKLSQVAGGFVNMGQKGKQEWTHAVEPKDNKKLQELIKLVETEKHQCPAIYCTHNHEISMIRKELKKRGLRGTAIRGSVKPAVRSKKIAKFQKGAYDFIILQVKIGSVGITITKSSLCIYYSNTFNMRLRLQSEDRLHRIGQEKNVTYVDLIGTLASGAMTVDRRIYTRLKEKKGLADLVTGDALKKFIS